MGTRMPGYREYMDFVREKGIPLHKILHINEYAFTLGNACLALELLKKHGIVILGGDVYIREDNKIRPDHSNWYVEKQPDETDNNYIERSWTKTQEYIEIFRKKNDHEYLFVFVT